METCPKCSRPVASLKTWHYCAQVDIDTLFERKSDGVVQLFDALVQSIGGWPGVAYSGTKRCIVFVSDKTFLIVRPMKTALDMHFSLAEPQEDFAVYKCVAYGGKWVHYVRLHDPDDLDAAVIRLVRMAYEGK